MYHGGCLTHSLPFEWNAGPYRSQGLAYFLHKGFPEGFTQKGCPLLILVAPSLCLSEGLYCFLRDTMFICVSAQLLPRWAVGVLDAGKVGRSFHVFSTCWSHETSSLTHSFLVLFSGLGHYLPNSSPKQVQIVSPGLYNEKVTPFQGPWRNSSRQRESLSQINNKISQHSTGH